MALNSNFRTLTADNIEGVVSTRNYLRNSFENGTTFGWTELNVALTNGLPTGTPTISATAATSLVLQTTNTPLSLDRSLFVQAPSALVAGNGFISDAFTIDRMDAGKVLTISFDYEMVEGTYNFSGTLGSQTWMVYVYNDTAGGANWIQPAGFLGMNQSSGPGRVTCTFQSSVVWGQKYRVAVIASQAASGMSSINFDNFTCSRQVNPIGQLRNPAGTIIATGSLTPPNGYLYCNGDVLSRTDYAELFAAIGTSYNTGGETGAQFRLPDLRGIFARGAGTNPNNANNTTTIGARQLDAFGSHDHGGTIGGGTHTHNYTVRDGGGTSQKGLYSGNASWPNPNIRNLAEFDTGGHSHTIPASGGTETRPANVGVAYHICFSSGSVQLSSDTDTRVVGFNGSIGAVAYTANSTNISATAVRDTHASWNGTQYVAPVSGDYIAMFTTIANTTNGFGYMFVNGSAVSGYGSYQATANQAGSGTQYLPNIKAGDLISLRIGGSNGTTVAGGAISIFRISGPSVIAASETVACAASNTSGQSIPTSNTTPTVLTGWTKDYDTHSFFNASSGVATIPVSGKYLISAQVLFNTNANNNRWLIIFIDNVGAKEFIIPANASFNSLSVNYCFNLRAGQTVDIRVQQNSGGALTLNNNANQNFVCIERVGQ